MNLLKQMNNNIEAWNFSARRRLTDHLIPNFIFRIKK